MTFLRENAASMAPEGVDPDVFALKSWSVVHGLALLMLDALAPADNGLTSTGCSPRNSRLKRKGTPAVGRRPQWSVACYRRLGALPPAALLGRVGIGLGNHAAGCWRAAARSRAAAAAPTATRALRRRPVRAPPRGHVPRPGPSACAGSTSFSSGWRGVGASSTGSARGAARLRRAPPPRRARPAGAWNGPGMIGILARPETGAGPLGRNLGLHEIAVGFRDDSKALVGRLRRIGRNGAFAVSAASATPAGAGGDRGAGRPRLPRHGLRVCGVPRSGRRLRSLLSSPSELPSASAVSSASSSAVRLVDFLLGFEQGGVDEHRLGRARRGLAAFQRVIG